MKKDKLIDSLMARQIPTADAITKAIEARRVEKEAQLSKTIMLQLESIEDYLDHNVSKLRKLREEEKAQKAKVIAISEAKDQYLKDADFDAFSKTVVSLSRRC